MSTFYPIALNLNDQLCIVVGGGKIALRKALKLLESGARIKLISPTINQQFHTFLKENPGLSWVQSSYTGKQDLDSACLIFAATDDPSLNQKIGQDARSLGILTNIASHGGLSDFITPASFNQGDLQISISTSGKVPGLSKAIKDDLESTLGPEYSILIAILEQIRRLAINDLDNKSDNLSTLSGVTHNYTLILDQINAGIDPKRIYKELLEQLK